MPTGSGIAILLTLGVIGVILSLLVVRSLEMRATITGIEEPLVIEGIKEPIILVTPTPEAPFGGYVVVSTADDLTEGQVTASPAFTGPLYTAGAYDLVAQVPTPLPPPTEDPDFPELAIPSPTPAYLFILVEPTPGRPNIVELDPEQPNRHCDFPPVTEAPNLRFKGREYLVLRTENAAELADLAQEVIRMEWNSDDPPICGSDLGGME